MMDRVRLNIIGLSYSQTQTGAYALVLSEVEGQRRLPIIIGSAEAQSIAIALERDVIPPRPLTHDLFKSFADTYGINVIEVLIHTLEDGVFHAHIVCKQGGIEKVLDARTSDAIALAIRFKCPIFTYEHILQKAGIFLEESTQKEEDKSLRQTTKEKIVQDSEEKESKDETKEAGSAKSPFSRYSIKTLKNMMDKAVKDEDYEKAARIRDELDRRKGQ